MSVGSEMFAICITGDDWEQIDVNTSTASD
jgi:hypothetical protein